MHKYFLLLFTSLFFLSQINLCSAHNLEKEESEGLIGITQVSESNQVSETTPEVIILGKVTEDSIIYKSKKEYIREYTPYAFALFCIFIICLLTIELIRTKRIE